MTQTVPPGFQLLEEGLGFTDILRPLYRRSGDTPALGMFVQGHHTNLLNICHGGVLMTLADIGASWAINNERGEVKAAPTLNLGFDFISAAREGDWIQAQADSVSVKRRVGFSSGFVTTGDKIICRFSGTFFIPEPGTFEFNPSRLAKLHG